MNPVLTGAIAGTVATAAMTWAMVRMHKRLPASERYPLPPREITQDLAERAGLARSLGEEGLRNASLASHFAYGAAVGGLYGALGSRFAPGGTPTAAGGVAYGLAVWAGSYLGWIPALNVLRLATRHPARRNALMLAAHVVWGAATGLVAASMREADVVLAGKGGLRDRARS